MRTRTILALLALSLVPLAADAAPAVPPAPILKLASAVIAAANADNVAGFAGLYTADAVVVDENPPFVWRGAGAGAAWWNAVRAIAKKMKLTHIKAINVRIGEFRESATDAYLVESMTVAGLMNGKPFAESGTQTYTFHKAGEKWLVSTQVWTTKP
ncbi:MAG TPA: DUF4440 domain-containing protein [Candidatus Nitrosotalea sp.]|nr:DUF4440 domain-containing protein [Candidatus Nitrosotalea sp.]